MSTPRPGTRPAPGAPRKRRATLHRDPASQQATVRRADTAPAAAVEGEGA
ncbi:hypothetical protein [Streptomyces xanthii]|uniref:Uncharacterized protein n=1 Tax=Streptomyces xanthii TaxID=2768069 RepID=A0A7H1B2Z6_9ACTN|nr:hypothetical protein [Streptomyces xanthii]QNS03101.1 hypothetical protein IAG42_05330 [Streptomyces xanthii]